MFRFQLQVGLDFSIPVQVLVDTGSEVNLLRKGLVPDRYFRQASVPMRFVAAKQTTVSGGQREVKCNLKFDTVDPTTRAKIN